MSEPTPGTTPDTSPAPHTRLTPGAFLQRRREGQTVYVFDLRDAEGYATGHLMSAFNLPFEYLNDSLYRMPFAGDILLMDGGEGLASQAAQLLADNGFTDLYYLEEGWEALRAAQAADPQEVHWDRLTREDRVHAIERVLTDKVRDMLARDGGGLEVEGVDEDQVLVSYQGACGACPSSTTGTLRFIEQTLAVHLNHDIRVIPIDAASMG